MSESSIEFSILLVFYMLHSRYSKLKKLKLINYFLKNNRKNYTFKVIAIYQELETQYKTCKYLFK